MHSRACFSFYSTGVFCEHTFTRCFLFWNIFVVLSVGFSLWRFTRYIRSVKSVLNDIRILHFLILTQCYIMFNCSLRLCWFELKSGILSLWIWSTRNFLTVRITHNKMRAKKKLETNIHTMLITHYLTNTNCLFWAEIFWKIIKKNPKKTKQKKWNVCVCFIQCAYQALGQGGYEKFHTRTHTHMEKVFFFCCIWYARFL